MFDLLNHWVPYWYSPCLYRCWMFEHYQLISALICQYSLSSLMQLQNKARMLSISRFGSSTSQNNNELFAKNKWEMFRVPFVGSPIIKPLQIKVEFILLNTSMTITIRRENKRSHCLRPWDLLTKPTRLSFTKTEYFAIDMLHCLIQENHLSPNPHFSSKYIRNSQLIWS